MFGSRHYVPIVRWKMAEMRALAELHEADKANITPFVEIPRSRFEGSYNPSTGKYSVPSSQSVLDKIANQVGELGLVQRCFLDFGTLDRCRRPFLVGKRSPWLTVKEHLAPTPSLVVPVSRLYRDSNPHVAAIREFASIQRRGACLRLQEEDLELTDLANRVDRLLNNLRLSPKEVDLLVDLGVTYEEGRSFASVCSRLPFLADWRSFTVSSGHFPADLQRFERGQEHRLRRADLQRWRTEVENGLARKPAYGDYTVQHAVYIPPPDAPLHPSASIRYALKDHWLILRGEDYTQENGPGKGQWIGWAQLLCTKPEFAEFGPGYSAGDAFIHSKSVDGENHGEGTDWLFAGINHHMTLTSRQVASAPAL